MADGDGRWAGGGVGCGRGLTGSLIKIARIMQKLRHKMPRDERAKFQVAKVFFNQTGAKRTRGLEGQDMAISCTIFSGDFYEKVRLENAKAKDHKTCDEFIELNLSSTSTMPRKISPITYGVDGITRM